jgi:subfamily B ATP-binding cassette protein MsbA
LIVIFLSITVGFLDGIGLTMFLPLIQLADNKSKALSSGNFSFVVDFINKFGFELNILTVLSFLLFFFVLKGIALFLSNYYKIVVRQLFISSLRLKLLFLLENLSYKSFVLSNVGKIQNSLTNEINRVSIAYITYIGSLNHIVLVMVYMTMAIIADWKFALLVCVGGILSNFLYKRMYAKTKKESVALTENAGVLQGLVMQLMTNYKYLKATGYIRKYNLLIKKNIIDLENNNKTLGRFDSIIIATREPILITIVCVVIFIKIYYLKGNIGSLIISLLFFYRALTSLLSVQSNYNSFLSFSGSIDEIFNTENFFKANFEQNNCKNKIIFNDKIELRNLFFSYIENNNILKNVNIEIKKNESVAFIGESGSGKSTLVNLIAGLTKPSSGEILFDNIDSKELDIFEFQNKIGYITQEPVIFTDTIYNNITFWADKTEDNYSRFEFALKQASIYDFVYSLIDKEDSLLGSNGLNLSGGQKQRLSIARELYKNVEILILDEATSALDSENEKMIQENIEKLQGQYTIILISHRLSTIKNADVIYIFENGEIKEKGTFQELLSKSKRFNKIVSLQQIND